MNARTLDPALNPDVLLRDVSREYKGKPAPLSDKVPTGQPKEVTRFEAKAADPAHPSERMRCAIDSAKGRQLYSQRIGTVEPVFGNLRHNKRLTRLNHRGRAKVNTQWHLYCMVHNIEKLAKTTMGQQRR